MHLKLILRRPSGQTVDLSMVADATASVGDVARALADGDPRSSIASNPDLTLTVEQSAFESAVDGRQLDPGVNLVDSGVRSGSTVTIGKYSRSASVSRRGRAIAMLRVLSGPDAGREFLLPEGASTIGSSAESDISLSDGNVLGSHARIHVGESIEIVDHTATGAGIHMGGKWIERTFVAGSDVVGLGDTTIAVFHTVRARTDSIDSPAMEFNRSPRVIRRFDGRTFEAPQPPKRVDPNRFPIVSMLAPLFLGLVLFAVTRNTLTVVFIALSPLLMLGMYIDTALQNKRKHRDAIEQFATGLRATAADMQSAQTIERAVRLGETPSVSDAVEAVHLLGTLLWTHRPEHAGFLTVRMGLGDAPSRSALDLPSRAESLPEYWQQLETMRDEFATITDVPIVADLRSSGSLGVCGPRGVVDGVARGIVIQLVGLHSPAELTIAAVASSATRPSWSWLEWLPHSGPTYSPLSGDLFADSADGGISLVARLEDLVRDRLDASEVRTGLRKSLDTEQDGRPTLNKTDPILPVVVVVVEDDAPVDRSRLTRLAERGPDANVHLIWVATQLTSVPAACRSFLLVETNTSGSTAGEVRVGKHTFPVASETVDVPDARQIALLLAPVIDVGVSVEDETDLPRSVSFLDLDDPSIATDHDVLIQRWERNNSILKRSGPPPPRRTSDNSLRALVGSRGIEPFHLDLREHGPHALVGGTTGSGKSEFLQAWILGMAAEHSPDRVSFLFVDYKGGTAFADCVDLPHSVGLVTDLSPHLVRRALISLRAEIGYRERLLNRKREKDLLSLERSHDPETPPSLLIIVDEFAALAKEIPEFVDGVVDIAQRGRSLGLHLILATQRPAGVIKDNLRANTNLRVALRMADEDDSVDVLGSKDAAYFSPGLPGRATAKVGPGRLTTFQTAYTGGWTVGADTQTPIDITEMNFGDGKPWDATVQMISTDSQDTDMVRVVRSITRAAEQARIPAPRVPWLPELRRTYDIVIQPASAISGYSLGISDDPATQSQPAVYFDPDKDGNLAVFGTGGSGKSTALRTVAIAAVQSAAEQGPIEIYGIDFGSGGLRMLDELPETGAIVGDDDEILGRLMRRLTRLVDDRSENYSKVNASNIVEYRTITRRLDEPRVLLLVDGIGAFREAYESSPVSPWFSMLNQIATDGRALGVHLVVSADRPNAIPTSLGSTIQRRLVLRMASDDDYLLLGAPKDVLDRVSPPGRGILDDREVQISVIGGDPNVEVQFRGLATLADVSRAAGVRNTAAVERLSDDIDLAVLPDTVANRPTIGIAYTDLDPVGFDPRGLFMVAGPPFSGRSSALLTLARSVLRAEPDVRTFYLAPRAGGPEVEDVWDSVAVGLESVAALITEIIEQSESSGSPRIMVVVESLCEFTDSMVQLDLERMIKSVDAAGGLVVGESEISTWQSSYALGGPFRSNRRGILLCPSDIDGESLLNTPLGSRQRGVQPPGRGFLVAQGKAVKLQLARQH
ncbi:FtsK/SpoIIIE domain-containing protein [Rhodococcoides yunnanense]|uniref:FtsK/SpoIIIE domain-containing protein n=1 Tax=Rhodococcoides yunnanense TaxID=278209 RepID=UPI0009327EED|nr:FtsK/SpoIIIE domain-containing protein [Rhodococcus yunnanensis]